MRFAGDAPRKAHAHLGIDEDQDGVFDLKIHLERGRPVRVARRFSPSGRWQEHSLLLAEVAWVGPRLEVAVPLAALGVRDPGTAIVHVGTLHHAPGGTDLSFADEIHGWLPFPSP